MYLLYCRSHITKCAKLNVFHCKVYFGAVVSCSLRLGISAMCIIMAIFAMKPTLMLREIKPKLLLYACYGFAGLCYKTPS